MICDDKGQHVIAWFELSNKSPMILIQWDVFLKNPVQ